MSVRIKTKLAAEICEALGLKNVTKLDLHFSLDALATVEATFLAESDAVEKLPAIIKRYVLLETEE